MNVNERRCNDATSSVNTCRDFLIYSGENESWQRKLTTEDTEDTEDTESRCFSLCSSVNSVVFQTIPEDNKKSLRAPNYVLSFESNSYSECE